MKMLARRGHQEAKVKSTRSGTPLVLIGTGVGIAFAATGIVVAYRFAPTRARALQAKVSSPVRDLARTLDTGARSTATVGDDATDAGATMRRGDAVPPSNASSPSDEQRATGRFIGNRSTRVYHDGDDGHLPAEEHRVYFETEEEAEALGYRPAGQPAKS